MLPHRSSLFLERVESRDERSFLVQGDSPPHPYSRAAATACAGAYRKGGVTTRLVISDHSSLFTLHYLNPAVVERCAPAEVGQFRRGDIVNVALAPGQFVPPAPKGTDGSWATLCEIFTGRVNAPRSLKTRTVIPSWRLRTAASWGCISSVRASCSCLRLTRLLKRRPPAP